MHTSSRFPSGILTLDTHHMGRTHVVASYVLLGDEPALVDPGPAGTLPNIEAALAQHDMTLADIRHIIVTHVHLDHSGAAGKILERNPSIQVHVHEKGAPHLIDPSRLVNSASQLWGDELDTLWGRPVPVPAAAVKTLTGGERVYLGSRCLQAYDAPGHAKHHLVWYDEQSGTAFVGDNAGVRLPLMTFTRPATPPPDVDLEAWQRTFDMILGLKPVWLMPTHFGAYNDVEFHIHDVRERLMHWAEMVRQGLKSGASEAEQIAALTAQAESECASLSQEEQIALTQQSATIDLSWYGLARYWQKKGVV